MPKVNSKLSSNDKINLLTEMVRIRMFEQISLKYYLTGNIGGFLHLYIGQESIAVATASLMGENDHIITAYRDHAHAIAVGMSMNECMAELFGKKTGCSKGKGGSMHLFNPSKNFWGGHGIVAGQTPLGAGIAFALKHKNIKGSCMCFLGEGAVNQGVFHESLNLASLWNLPVIYVIENNGYSMGTSQKRSSSYPKKGLASRAEGYNMHWEVVDGQNIYKVRDSMSLLIDKAHEESKPSILEIKTYRYKGHSVADANNEKYRDSKEIEDYKKNKDPIIFLKNDLIKEGIITEDGYNQINKESIKEAEDSAKFAEESPFPDPSEIFDDIYWEIDNNTKYGRIGKHFF